MPIYEYRCMQCGTKHQILHLGREIKEEILCPSCSSSEHKKLISSSSFSMKGIATSESSNVSGGCCGGACGLN